VLAARSILPGAVILLLLPKAGKMLLAKAGKMLLAKAGKMLLAKAGKMPALQYYVLDEDYDI
jgi:hypothetical protein